MGMNGVNNAPESYANKYLYIVQYCKPLIKHFISPISSLLLYFTESITIRKTTFQYENTIQEQRNKQARFLAIIQ